MKNPRLHFSARSQADRPLLPGVHRVARAPDGAVVVADAPGGEALAQFCVDRRGIWLQVAEGARAVHVNGRPVRRMALLRAGDAVYVEGMEMLLQAPGEAPLRLPPPSGPPAAPDPCLVLRGVGGQHHGRCFALDVPRLLGAAAEADVRVEYDDAVAARHARLERHGDRVLLRGLDPARDTLVNGVAVHDAWLGPGDQLALGVQHRFVIEVPAQPAAEEAGDSPGAAAAEKDETGMGITARPSARRWPWLLLAALLLAAALNALLWYGVG